MTGAWLVLQRPKKRDTWPPAVRNPPPAHRRPAASISSASAYGGSGPAGSQPVPVQ